MEDMSREKLIVALRYVRTLMQEVADDAEEKLLAKALPTESEAKVERRTFWEPDFREERQWALERIVSLTADIEKLGGDRYESKEPEEGGDTE